MDASTDPGPRPNQKSEGGEMLGKQSRNASLEWARYRIQVPSLRAQTMGSVPHRCVALNTRCRGARG